MRLDRFDNSAFQRGRPWPVEGLWRAAEGLLFGSWIPGSAWRVALLRLFGARVGRGVVIKPRVRVKFPWRLCIGDHSWIGEDAWLDNLAEIRIGSHCCLSQGVYLCTGNHRWDADDFRLETRPIHVEDHCWIGAQARVGPGVTCRAGAVLTFGSLALADLEAWSVYSGMPAARRKARTVSRNDAPAGRDALD
jgi:putative colanic acid biosynthesis acetyltransferase WcaF